MTPREFRARHTLGNAPVSGTALVATDGFSARYDLDRLEGVFSRVSHKLYGQSYVNRILVLDCAKGGVATAWMLHEMKARHMLPLAIVLNRANPIMAQGAALAGICLLAGFDGDITTAVTSGAQVEIDPIRGVLRVADAMADTVRAAIPMPVGYQTVHGP